MTREVFEDIVDSRFLGTFGLTIVTKTSEYRLVSVEEISDTYVKVTQVFGEHKTIYLPLEDIVYIQDSEG